MSDKWTGFLKFMAWLNVIISFITMIILFAAFGKTDAQYGYAAAKVTNWPIIGLGIGLMLESLFILGFIMVICLIAEKAGNIVHYSEKLSRHFIPNEKSQKSNEWECPKCGHNNPNDLYVCDNCNYRIG